MRLGQLARKLAIKPFDILEFLAQKNISLENDSNARLGDDLVALITNHFTPEATVPGDFSVPIGQDSPDFIKPDVPSEEPVQTTEENVPSLKSHDGQSNKEPAVIKAPRIELSGLKVIGKIDLPEPKKKITPSETNPSQEDTTSQTPSKVPERKRSIRRERDEQSAGNIKRVKNPIALQREHEAMEAEQMRQARAVQQKEQRTKNYLKKVRTVPPIKSVKLMTEPTEEFSGVEDTPRTLLGKFFRWLKK